MPVAAIPTFTDLVAKCTPSYGTGSLRCGGLTLFDASATVGTEVASIYSDGAGKYRIWGALIEADFVGRACQVKQNVLYDFLMKYARGWGTKRISVNATSETMREVVPFVIMARKGIINANFWNVTAGVNTPGTSPGSIAYGAYFDLVSQTGIGADARWFSAKSEVFINGKSSGGLATHTQWTVVDAAVQSATTLRIYVNSVNALSNLAAGKLEFPTAGRASRGVPNVSKWDSYCTEIPALNMNQNALFWISETRRTYCFDEETEELFKLLRENNPAFERFGDVDTVEKNRQITEDYQKRFVETVFWSKAVANQTINLYTSLPTITALDGTPITNYLNLAGVTGRVMGRRANTVGFYEQLAECGRVKDLGGDVLNIPELLGELYKIWRARQDNNIMSNVIELITDMNYAVQLKQGFFRWKNSRYEGALRVNLDEKEMQKSTTAGFNYTDITVDYPTNLTIRIVTHLAFDDLLSSQMASGSGLNDVGRWLLILDLGNSMYVSIIESASQRNTTGDLAALSAVNTDAMCRMAVPKRSVLHNSVKFVTVVECPAANLWIENISGAIPEHCGPVGDATDLHGDIA